MSADVELSILLPTRGRPDLVRRFMDSVAVTAEEPRSIEVILRLDRDDPASRDIDHPGLRVRRIVDWPAGMGRMVRQCYQASSGRIIAQMNDDVVCRSPGWDRAVRDALAQYPDGVALLWCDDGWRGRRMPNLPFLPRACCELLAGPCPAEYRRDYIDTHLYDLFRKLQRKGHHRLIFLPDVLLEHLHHETGKSSRDATSHKPRQQLDEVRYLAWEPHRCLLAERLAQQIRDSSPCTC